MPPQSSGVFSERRELMGMSGMGKKEIGMLEEVEAAMIRKDRAISHISNVSRLNCAISHSKSSQEVKNFPIEGLEGLCFCFRELNHLPEDRRLEKQLELEIMSRLMFLFV